MWPSFHSQMVFTAGPSTRLGDNGSNNQNFTGNLFDPLHQTLQQLPPVPAYPPDILSSALAPQVEPTIRFSSIGQHVPPPLQDPEPQNRSNRAGKRKRASEHPHYSVDDWEYHRPAIKKLYIDQDRSLDETMKEMSAGADGFNPSKKRYKEKIDEWGYKKHVPSQVAHWMRRKAEQRSRPDLEHPKGRETRFIYGTLTLTTADIQKRTKNKANLDLEGQNDIDAPTPKGIIYDTPREIAESPPTTRSLRPSGGAVERWIPPPSPPRPQALSLPPTYKKHTLADLDTIEREACQLESQGESCSAENLYREALTGFRTILSPTHEHTSALAYRLATFYADHDRMDDADQVLNWMMEKHIERWGVGHGNTLKHLLQVAKLYNGWSRNDEALSVLYRVLDTWDEQVRGKAHDKASLNGGETRQMGPPGAVPRTTVQYPESNPASRTWTPIDHPSRVDYQLGLENTRLESGDDGVEDTLLLLIDCCENDWQTMGVQLLQARCKLIDLYKGQEDEEKRTIALLKAREAVYKTLKLHVKKTERLLKACIEVGKLHLQAQDGETAEDILESIAAEAEDVFRTNCSAMLAILVQIGKIYQNEDDWTKAQPWFERALAASLAVDERESPVAKALKKALETRHYSSSSLIDDNECIILTFDELQRTKFIV